MILGLGAVLLLVAATIFISVSWDRLGLFGRSMVLFAATATMALAAGITSWRRLRASSEALWAVTFGLLTLDWFAAREQGLFTLDQVPGPIHVGAWSVLLALVAVPTASISSRRLGRRLLTPQLYAGLAPWGAVPAVLVYLWSDADWRPFWAGAVGALLVLLVAALGWRLNAVLALYLVAPLALVMAPFLVVTAVIEALGHPSVRELVGQGHGAPLVTIAVVALLVAALVPRGRVVATAIAVLAAESLVVVALVAEAGEQVGAVVVAFALAAGAWTVRRSGAWARGVQTALMATAIIAALFVVSGWVEQHLEPPTVGALALGVAAAVAGAGRWRKPPMPTALVRPAVLITLVCGLLATLATAQVPPAVQAAVGLAAAAGVGAWLLNGTRVEQWVGPVLVIVALAPASSSDGVAAWAFFVASLLYVMLSTASRWWPVRTTSAVLATLTAAAAGMAFCAEVHLDARAMSLWLVLVALTAWGVASWFVDDLHRRIALELAAAVVFISSLLTGLDTGSASWFALLFLLASLALFGAAFDVPDRRWAGVPAVVLAVLAWLCFVVGEEFAAVEAFTVPLAAAALGLGGWFFRRNPSLRSVVAFGVGLALAFLPSLPQALGEPTSIRAAVLGLAAVVALAVGWWRSWQAPFVVGAAVVMLLVVVNLWPVAMAVQRWVLFGILGIVLLAIGVTWESRVRQGRAAWRVIAAMR